MTKIEIEEHAPIRVNHEISQGWYSEEFITLKSDDFKVSIWLDPDEARELVKALKKHIKKAEGK